MTDPDSRPLHERVPPASVASPSDLRLPPGQAVTWYLPGWLDTFHLLGWRCLYLLPPLLVVAMVLAIPFFPGLIQLLWMFWKIATMAVAVPAVLLVHAARQVIQQRKDPFCIHCGYSLTGLPDHHACPECGMPYTFGLIAEYRRDPHWFIQRYKSQHLLPRPDAPFEAGAVRPKRRSRDGT